MIIQDILNYLEHSQYEYTFIGNDRFEIYSYCPLKELKKNAITWVRKLTVDVAENLNFYLDLVVFLEDCEEIDKLKCNYIIVKNPHRVFFEIIEHFFYSRPQTAISKSAVIETEKIGDNLSVGALSYIGPNVIIGNNCVIGNNVTIENSVIIGDDVMIDSGVRIGTTGFGHYLNSDGTSTLIPHIGGVSIGNHVFIGANTIVARGTLSNTIIRDYVKIDALCGICHNSEIQERVIITGGAGVAGSAVVKKDSWLAPGCIINSGITVGEGCMIGINSVVTHDIPDGKYAFGVPAKIIRDNEDKKYKI